MRESALEKGADRYGSEADDPELAEPTFRVENRTFDIPELDSGNSDSIAAADELVWAYQPEEASVQPEEASVEPEKSSVEPEEASVEPEKSSVEFEESSVEFESMETPSANGPADANPFRDAEVESVVGIQRSICVDKELLSHEGIIVSPENAAELRDQMRRIKWPVLENAFGVHREGIQNGNVIMIASAMSGEGKTFTSVNLAMSVANERDFDALLIDADIAKPHTSELFGVADYKGFIDFLSGDVDDIESVLVETDLPGLSLLPAGRADEHASELIASRRMLDLIDQLQAIRPNTLIIFDSSPVLQTNESHVLSKIVGQVVFVVAANKTPQNAVVEAVSLLGREQVINVVFNGLKSLFGQGHIYGGYYGYRDRGPKDYK
jgi:exopolysaccharide/PEP-CTERM locus tyrosine autokinase